MVFIYPIKYLLLSNGFKLSIIEYMEFYIHNKNVINRTHIFMLMPILLYLSYNFD